MTIFDLGQQLREKQLRLKLIPAELVNVITNEDIVDAYFVCSICEEWVFTPELEQRMIEESEDADEFTERVTIGLKWHQRIKHTKPL